MPADCFHCCLAVALFSACSNTKAEPSAGTVVETNTDPNVFTMQSPGQFPLTTVEVRKVSDEIHVNGVIAPDVNRSVPVVSLGGGRVVEIKAKLGDYVQKGQVLLLINSPDLSAAFSDYQKFKADQQLADKQLARAKLLYDKGAIAAGRSGKRGRRPRQGHCRPQRRHPARACARRRREQSLSAAAFAGADFGDDRRSADYWAERACARSTISQSLFTIADLSVVWVLCDVYQDMLPRVHVGDIAEINVTGYAENFPGKVINISQVLDPNTRAAKVRIELPNPHGIMRAGMFVTATFRARQPVERVSSAGIGGRSSARQGLGVPAGGRKPVPARGGAAWAAGEGWISAGHQRIETGRPGRDQCAAVFQRGGGIKRHDPVPG